MPRHTIRCLTAGLLFAMAALAAASQALACACCTESGQRMVQTVPLDSGKLQELTSLRFAGDAKRYTGAGEAEAVPGIASASTAFRLSATLRDDRFVFSFRDEKDQTGTLSLQRPNTISIFEVDPRTGADRGQGPTLYKEWKVTSRAVGSGILSAGTGAGQLLTLIVQGSGNSCTSAPDFTHWTLVMQGPKANYQFLGELLSTPSNN